MTVPDQTPPPIPDRAPAVVHTMQTIRMMLLARDEPPWSVILNQLKNYRADELLAYCDWWNYAKTVETAVMRHCVDDAYRIEGGW